MKVYEILKTRKMDNSLTESAIEDIYANFKNVDPKERVFGIQKYLMKKAGPITKNGQMYWQNVATRQTYSLDNDRKFRQSVQQAAQKLNQTLFATTEMSETATGGSTAAGNIASVTSLPGAYRKIKKDKKGIPKAPQATNPDGTAKNAVDLDLNLMGGKPIKR